MIKTFEAFINESINPNPADKMNIKKCLADNPELYYDVITQYNGYTGMDFVAYNNPEGLEELFGEFENDEILSKFQNGYYCTDDKYVGFDDKGNFKSFNDLYSHINIDDVVDWLFNPDGDSALINNAMEYIYANMR